MEHGSVLIIVHQARNLMSVVGAQGPPSTFVLVSILDKRGGRIESKRTHTVKKESNPLWDSKIILDINASEVEQIELAVYDRDPLIVDELLGVLFINPKVLSTNHAIQESWFTLHHPNRGLGGSSNFVSPLGSSSPHNSTSPSFDLCISAIYVDSDTKQLVEEQEKMKGDERMRRKEIRRMFALDEDFFFDCSCSFDSGTLPHNGRLYLTASKLLFNSTFKQKRVGLESIQSIEKIKATLMFSAGIMLQIKGGKKLIFKNFRNSRLCIDAIQTRLRGLGLQPVPVIDAGIEASQDVESDEDIDQSSVFSKDCGGSSTNNHASHFHAALKISPPNSTPSSPPNSFRFTRSSTSSAHTTELESTSKKDSTKSKTGVGAIVRTVSDRIRNISVSANTVAASKDSAPPLSAPVHHSSGSIGVVLSSSASDIRDVKEVPPTSSSPVGSASPSQLLAQHSSSVPYSSSLQPTINQSSSVIQVPQSTTKNKSEKEGRFGVSPASFLKDFTLPFHLPGSKRRAHSIDDPTTLSQAAGEEAEDSLSSSEKEQADSAREKEISHRLKYYLIHGEVPLGSGEEESDTDFKMLSKNPASLGFKQASDELQRSEPGSPEVSDPNLVTASGSDSRNMHSARNASPDPTMRYMSPNQRTSIDSDHPIPVFEIVPPTNYHSHNNNLPSRLNHHSRQASNGTANLVDMAIARTEPTISNITETTNAVTSSNQHIQFSRSSQDLEPASSIIETHTKKINKSGSHSRRGSITQPPIPLAQQTLQQSQQPSSVKSSQSTISNSEESSKKVLPSAEDVTEQSTAGSQEEAAPTKKPKKRKHKKNHTSSSSKAGSEATSSSASIVDSSTSKVASSSSSEALVVSTAKPKLPKLNHQLSYHLVPMEKVPLLVIKTFLLGFVLAIAVLIKTILGTSPGESLRGGNALSIIGFSILASAGAVIAQFIAIFFQTALRFDERHITQFHPMMLSDGLPVLFLLCIHSTLVFIASSICIVAFANSIPDLVATYIVTGAKPCILYVLFSSAGCHILARRAAEVCRK